MNYLRTQATKRSGYAANKNLLVAWNWGIKDLDLLSPNPCSTERFPEDRKGPGSSLFVAASPARYRKMPRSLAAFTSSPWNCGWAIRISASARSATDSPSSGPAMPFSVTT
jgi:hypothetical protein